MSKRLYKRTDNQLHFEQSLGVLPTNRPVAVYYRQSTDAQIGNISTAMQTIDMQRYLVDKGWSKEQIVLIDMDGGISGTTRIDERPGMRYLFDLITDGELGAVACQDEDRLFRDITQIQVNTFIEACRVSNTLVITPTMVYDFSHPEMGSFYIRQFRFKSEMSAEYINSYLRGRLHPAKRRLMLEGKWAGWTVPLGFLIDTRKQVNGGAPNPNYRKYTPFDPHVSIVRQWYQILLDKAGNVHSTMKHIHKYGPFYPDPNTTAVPDGFRYVPSRVIKDYGRGYCPGKVGLLGTLTNAAYLGHWAINDVIVIWDNHPAVLDEELFFAAFNYLSDVTLTGESNPHYRPFSKYTRPNLEEERPVERPLLSDMIFTELGGELRRAYTNYVKRQAHYAYGVYDTDPLSRVLWWRRSEYLDEPVIQLLLTKLKSTFRSEIWQQTFEEFKKGYEAERTYKKKHLSTLERTMENLLVSLETLTVPAMIEHVENRYREAEQEHERLKLELLDATAEIKRLEALSSLKAMCEPALQSWNEMTREEKVIVVQAFVKQIIVSPLGNQAIHVEIVWRDDTTDSLSLAKRGITYRGWLKEHERRLFSLVDSGASQEEICSHFPNRTWSSIYQKVTSVRGNGSLNLSPLPIKYDETFADYRDRVGSAPRQHRARTGERWNGQDTQRLKNMVAQGETQVAIAAAFPHRNWGRIRAKITEVCGGGVSIPGAAQTRGASGDVHKYETYEMYLLRKQREKSTENRMLKKSVIADIDTKPTEVGEDSLVNVETESRQERAPPNGPD